jgi:hypothetical protein
MLKGDYSRGAKLFRNESNYLRIVLFADNVIDFKFFVCQTRLVVIKFKAVCIKDKVRLVAPYISNADVVDLFVKNIVLWRDILSVGGDGEVDKVRFLSIVQWETL